MPVHTHYDNLKVTRNAPPEVIKAAYRAMAQRWHPDVNSSPNAAKVMRLLNEAYEVLSDPVRRAEHDRWILEQELAEDTRENATTDDSAPQPEPPKEPTGSAGSSPTQPPVPSAPPNVTAGVIAAGGALLIVVGSLVASFGGKSPVVASPPIDFEPTPEKYARCAGSYEPEKCRAAEDKLAGETPAEKQARQQRLAAAQQNSRPQSYVELPPSAALDPRPRAAPSPSRTDAALANGPSRHLGRVGSSGGLSSIEVDNTQGSGDVEVRIYPFVRIPRDDGHDSTLMAGAVPG